MWADTGWPGWKVAKRATGSATANVALVIDHVLAGSPQPNGCRSDAASDAEPAPERFEHRSVEGSSRRQTSGTHQGPSLRPSRVHRAQGDSRNEVATAPEGKTYRD
jgi:hypothetical protein